MPDGPIAEAQRHLPHRAADWRCASLILPVCHNFQVWTTTVG